MGKKNKSAFRAVNDVTNQQVPANTEIKVTFPTQQFDFNNEYNRATSTFRPDKHGIYLLVASAEFSPDNTNPYRVRIAIRVNGTDVARENDFFSTLDINNDISVTTIVELRKNDEVEVFLHSTIAGEIDSDPATTRFEGTKIIKK